MRPQVYPSVPSDVPDQSFRLSRITELDAFLSKEVDERRQLQKKYQRACKASQGVSAGVGVVGLGMEATGLALLATGVGALPGIMLASLGAGAFIVDLVCGLVTRKCTAKAAKHSEIMVAARTKLNSVHQIISKALVDGKISDEEFKLISDEIDRYQTLKEEIRSKARSSDTAESKNERMEKGREEVRAQFAKHMATFTNTPAA